MFFIKKKLKFYFNLIKLNKELSKLVLLLLDKFIKVRQIQKLCLAKWIIKYWNRNEV